MAPSVSRPGFNPFATASDLAKKAFFVNSSFLDSFFGQLVWEVAK